MHRPEYQYALVDSKNRACFLDVHPRPKEQPIPDGLREVQVKYVDFEDGDDFLFYDEENAAILPDPKARKAAKSALLRARLTPLYRDLVAPRTMRDECGIEVPEIEILEARVAELLKASS